MSVLTNGRRGVARKKLYDFYKEVITPNEHLNRGIVSFQGNKREPFYRWFKYKEGFSSHLVAYFLQSTGLSEGTLLDPFAGAGTSLFAARDSGWRALGIELHPVPLFAIEARLAGESLDGARFNLAVERVENRAYERQPEDKPGFPHLNITSGAFPPLNEQRLMAYWHYCLSHVKDPSVRKVLQFAALCVLEDISYTRKDGQYLRWDARSPKKRGKGAFIKGQIADFHDAITAKLRIISSDLRTLSGSGHLFRPTRLTRGPVDMWEGSCLNVLPEMSSDSVDLVVTSPPYCNRYDYTRTYALELALLGRNEEQVKGLRQSLLSCTVENRAKREQIKTAYEARSGREAFDFVEQCFDSVDALHEVLEILESFGRDNALNNTNIPRMVRNYFYEMSFVIYELARVMRAEGKVVMVNDNVRYAGEEVPVDLILSELARQMGFTVDKIWVLSRGKGNSSQQMGIHGRRELRKCVYVWQKE
ncbi:MAG: site-specific DNA-methyltransferase [Phycisphaerae bacterium]